MEHYKEVEEGVSTHPMVIHCWEEHGGWTQAMLMRIVSKHLTALDRQTTESINILEASKKPGESLNVKTEWGGAKIPSILVSNPKGVSKTRRLTQETQEFWLSQLQN